jgi:pyrimidine-nucleoside phosphorylase
MDALATIPGFRTRASGSEASAWLARAGHCHIQAGGDFAPLDILLFRRRQQLGTQAAPDLVVASLLGKKLAMGLDTGVVEIRVGVHGNFGSTVEEARANALLLIAVADELGINCRVFIQSSPRLQQPWIGRGEALLALQCVASSECEESLARHAAYCWRLVKMVLRTNAAQPSADRIRACLGDHLRVQGSDLDALAVRVQAIAEAPRIPLLASHDGFFEPDVAALRSALVELQAMEPGDYPDAAGVQMLLLGGEQVRAGQELCLVRTESASNERAVKSIERAMVVRAHPRSLPCSDEVLEVCDGG